MGQGADLGFFVCSATQYASSHNPQRVLLSGLWMDWTFCTDWTMAYLSQCNLYMLHYSISAYNGHYVKKRIGIGLDWTIPGLSLPGLVHIACRLTLNRADAAMCCIRSPVSTPFQTNNLPGSVPGQQPIQVNNPSRSATYPYDLVCSCTGLSWINTLPQCINLS